MPRLLQRLSRYGQAASMYWNVNLLTRLSLAERGELIFAFEIGGRAVEIDGDATRAEILRSKFRSLEDGVDHVPLGLAMLESMTGVAFGEEILQEVAGVHPVADWWHRTQ